MSDMCVGYVSKHRCTYHVHSAPLHWALAAEVVAKRAGPGHQKHLIFAGGTCQGEAKCDG